MLPSKLISTTSPSQFLLKSTIQSLQHHHPPSPLLTAFKHQQQTPNNDPISFHQTSQIHPHFHLTTLARYNFLITSYNKSSHHWEALKVYALMRNMDVEVDCFTVPSVLKACGHVSSSHLGREVHGFAVKSGLHCDVFVSNALIQMYSECGRLGSARQVFDEMPERDGVSWSTIIGGYVKCRLFGEAWGVVKEMNRRLVKPSEIAMISMADLIGDKSDGNVAKAIHSYVIKHSEGGEERLGVKLVTALIDMHAKCGNLVLARQLFNGLPQKGIVSWTAIIAGHIHCNRLKEGVDLFAQMMTGGIFPNAITMLSMILECGLVGALDLGLQLHGYVWRTGFSISLRISTALVDMYGKCGDIRAARTIFDSMEDKNVVTWTVMISAYARASCVDDAIGLFGEMRNSGVKPNQSTMVSLLCLCAEFGALDLGRWIHTYIEKESIEIDMVLNTALVDMYAKCGDIDGAHKLFTEAGEKDTCMWNVLMTGYGIHGFGERAMQHFNEMERLNLRPNDITFIGLLHACSHAGMVKEGKEVFRKMIDIYRLVPKIEHYGCMVDLLGRAALLSEARDIIESMPMKPNAVVWGALLAACKQHREPNMAELASRKLLEMDAGKCGYNALMSNIYASSGRWSDVARVRTAMRNRGIKKEPGSAPLR